MGEQCYLFIDGAYLRQRHSEMVSRVFNRGADLDFSFLRYAITTRTPEGARSQFRRVFYYDCLHDVAKVDETAEQLEARIRDQRAFFDRIQSNEGFHVRLGSLSGSSRKLRQKEVDILLAVEMLDNAFRGNITSAALVAGDLDFAPLVDSLVRLGTWVDIYHDPRSIAPGLLASADRGIPLTFQTYYSLCTAEFQKGNPLPQLQNPARGHPRDQGFTLRRKGRVQSGDSVGLYVRDGGSAILVGQDPGWLLLHDDSTVLENYFIVTQSAIEWTDDNNIDRG